LWYQGVKRGFDFVVALLGLFVLSPLFLMLATAIGISMGKPVVFSQARPGRRGKIFRMYKFRTMIPEDPKVTRTDEQRISPLGRWLRATSLDELPELVNVVRGDMSLVGPRPLLVDYLDKYTPKQIGRAHV